ncbi:alpha/beta fold hydrolase [Amycolatopsis aidingensis]|uniref:alpha/beta fold hydrolase n=1 Tax=Amycolatopsis aidingensis TaxID=2842453 RepID=UPI001E58B960|nr:alpha/beta hydrolase [Amycolatopsis aidingensis]
MASGADGLEVWRGPGTGRAVAMLHGIEDTWRSWQAVAGRLTGVRPYSIRLPWHSGADPAWRRRGTPAEWVRRALRLLPEPPDAVIGHSFGANAILTHLATTEDTGLSSVVLVAPFYRPAGFAVGPQLERRARGAFRKVLTEGMRLSAGTRLAGLDPEIAAGMAGKFLERLMPELFPVFFAEFAESGNLNLGCVSVPTLVIMGKGDEGLSLARADALAVAMPAATVRARRSYGHFCHMQQADQLCKDITDWLRWPSAGLAPPGECGEGSRMKLLDGEPTSLACRPRYEGANIRTWIGFKNFMYLVEEAILEYFRERGVGARSLYHRYGLGLEIVDSSVQLPMTLEVDDEVCATVVSGTPRPDRGMPFSVQLTVERDGRNVTALTGKVRAALVPVKDGSGTEPVPSFLEPYVVAEVAQLRHDEAGSLPVGSGQDVAEVLAPEGSNSYLWSWRASYVYCHFSDRLQHSAYVRAVEEVVDRFLYDRGLEIGRLLAERSWIPVVSRARVQLLDDVWMDETVHTVFTVQDVLKDIIYTARADSYVRRGGELVRTATASIVHGYAISRGELAGTVATLDADTQAALLGTAG